MTELDVLLSSYSDVPVKACDESAGEMEALRGVGEDERERCDVKLEDEEVPDSQRLAMRIGEGEGEKLSRNLRKGLEGEYLWKEGILDVLLVDRPGLKILRYTVVTA